MNFRYFGYLYNTLFAAFLFEISVPGFRNLWMWNSEWIYIADVTHGRFSLIDNKMLRLQGIELRRIRDILGHLYSTERLRVYCDILRTTLCRQICKSYGVRKTSWERRCEKDVLRKTLWEIYLFWPASFDWQMFVIKNSLHRLGAFHLWCLCFFHIYNNKTDYFFNLLIEITFLPNKKTTYACMYKFLLWQDCQGQWPSFTL